MRAVRFPALFLALAPFAAAPAVAGDASPIFNPARLSPSLNASNPAAFQFQRAVKAADGGTHSDHAYSHFHFDERAKSVALALAFERAERRNVIDVKDVATKLASARHASAFGMPVAAFEGNDDATRRVASAVAAPNEKPVVLAYASPAPVEQDTPLAAIASVAPIGEEADGLAALPDAVPVPTARPQIKSKVVQEDEPNKAGERIVREEPASKPERDKPRDREVALARPENPGQNSDRPNSSFGQSLRNIFGGGGVRAGNGVAVYDISAAKVYMPDGSVLQAHSGIGKMADNPKYQHVKMNGPTPAHTYHLKMRERRFHGVEAIRMLPVDGKNKFGRDGFLTHSMLLRGRPNQSHGCVAFKDYNKFLRAFKQGKVKKMIVVPSGGAAVARRGKAGVGA